MCCIYVEVNHKALCFLVLKEPLETFIYFAKGLSPFTIFPISVPIHALPPLEFQLLYIDTQYRDWKTTEEITKITWKD